MAKAALKLLGTARAWAPDVREGVLKRPDGVTSSVMVRVGPEPATPEALARGRAAVTLLARVGEEAILPLEAVVSAGGILARVYTRVEAVSAQRVLELCRARAQVVPSRVAVVLAAAVAKALAAVYALEADGWRGAHVGCGPEQLLLRRDGSIRLAGSTVEGPGGRVEARAGYRPPEGGSGEGTYMVGALLVELLTGEAPPSADGDRARHEQAVRRAVIRVLARPGDNPGESVGRLLQRVLAYDPATRGSVAELARYLEDLAARLPGVSPAAWLPDVLAAVLRALPPEPSTPPGELGVTDAVPSDIPLDGREPPRASPAPIRLTPQAAAGATMDSFDDGPAADPRGSTWSGELGADDTEDVPTPTSPLAAGPSRSGAAPSGPSLAGPSLAGPSLAGPSMAGPSSPGPGPSLAGPSLAGPALAGPAFGGPARGPAAGPGGPGPAGARGSPGIRGDTAPRAVRIEPVGPSSGPSFGSVEGLPPVERAPSGGSGGVLTAVATVFLGTLLVAGGFGVWWVFLRVPTEVVETPAVGEAVVVPTDPVATDPTGTPSGTAPNAADPSADSPPVGTPAPVDAADTLAGPAVTPSPIAPTPSPVTPAPVLTTPPAPAPPAPTPPAPTPASPAPVKAAPEPVGVDVPDPDEPVRISARPADPAPTAAPAPVAPVVSSSPGPFRVSFTSGDPSVDSLDVRCAGAAGSGPGPVVLDAVDKGTTCKITGSGADAPLLALVTVNADRSYTCFRSRSRSCQ